MKTKKEAKQFFYFKGGELDGHIKYLSVNTKCYERFEKVNPDDSFRTLVAYVNMHNKHSNGNPILEANV